MSQGFYFKQIEEGTKSQENSAIRELRGFSAAIKQFIGGPVDCELIPGNVESNLGREYKVILNHYPMQLFQTLLRAYISMDGTTVHLDLYDGNGPTKVTGIDDLKRRLGDFLQVPTVADSLETLREYAKNISSL